MFRFQSSGPWAPQQDHWQGDDKREGLKSHVQLADRFTPLDLVLEQPPGGWLGWALGSVRGQERRSEARGKLIAFIVASGGAKCLHSGANYLNRLTHSGRQLAITVAAQRGQPSEGRQSGGSNRKRENGAVGSGFERVRPRPLG